MQIKIDENETVITDNDVLGNAKECPKKNVLLLKPNVLYNACANYLIRKT